MANVITRSPFYLRRLDDQLKRRMLQESNENGKALWLIIEEALLKRYKMTKLHRVEQFDFLDQKKKPIKHRLGKHHNKDKNKCTEINT